MQEKLHKNIKFEKLNQFAEVSEWFKVQPWKGCVREIAPRVRISSSAPNFLSRQFCLLLFFIFLIIIAENLLIIE